MFILVAANDTVAVVIRSANPPRFYLNNRILEILIWIGKKIRVGFVHNNPVSFLYVIGLADFGLEAIPAAAGFRKVVKKKLRRWTTRGWADQTSAI